MVHTIFTSSLALNDHFSIPKIPKIVTWTCTIQMGFSARWGALPDGQFCESNYIVQYVSFGSNCSWFMLPEPSPKQVL